MSSKKRTSRSTSADPESEAPSLPVSSSTTQKVLLLNDGIASCDSAKCVLLRHPRTNSSVLFLMATDDSGTTHLSELNTFDEGNRSWFVGSTVLSDGKLYIATPYNPTYLILPYLMKAERNVPLDQLLEDEQYPATVRLAGLAMHSLAAVADSKGSADLNVWKYNEDKTAAWLEERARRLSQALMDRKVPTTTAQALTFVRTMDQQQTKEAYLLLAHGILSDYLPEELSITLRRRLGLPDIPTGGGRHKHRSSSDGGDLQPQVKKHKTDGPAEDYTKDGPALNKTVVPPSAKARALAKSAVGNKSIMSFFGKK